MKWLVGLLLLQFSLGWCTSDWTWAYRKRFSGSELDNLVGKAHLTFTKTNIPTFKQLIFSWNAYRPKQGYFTFYVQSQDAYTKKWSPWYRMVEWGSAVQRSHHVKFNSFDPQYHHVRLEQPTSGYANGFRLKVEAHGEAKLANLRHLAVTTADFSKLQPEVSASYSNLASFKIAGVPKYSQMVLLHDDAKKMCSPTASSMQVGYLTKKKVDPVVFAKKSFDHGLQAYGSWPFNTSHAFELYPKKSFRVARLDSFLELYGYLKKDIPVVVSVRGYMQGAPQEYKQGHLLLVIGWDQLQQSVICHDPAILGDEFVEYTYDLSDFLKAWERSHRLAYVVD